MVSPLRINADVAVNGNVQINGNIGSTMAEDIAFGATEMNRGAATLLVTNQLPRIELPAGVTTNVQVGGFNFPNWYLPTVDMHIVWVNEGAGAQTPTFAWNLRQVNVGQAMSAGALISSSFAAPPNIGQGIVTTTILAPTITITPGGLGYILGLEIARLGGSDSLPNSISLVAVGFSKKVT